METIDHWKAFLTILRTTDLSLRSQIFLTGTLSPPPTSPAVIVSTHWKWWIAGQIPRPGYWNPGVNTDEVHEGWSTSCFYRCSQRPRGRSLWCEIFWGVLNRFCANPDAISILCREFCLNFSCVGMGGAVRARVLAWFFFFFHRIVLSERSFALRSWGKRRGSVIRDRLWSVWNRTVAYNHVKIEGKIFLVPIKSDLDVHHLGPRIRRSCILSLVANRSTCWSHSTIWTGWWPWY